MNHNDNSRHVIIAAIFSAFLILLSPCTCFMLLPKQLASSKAYPFLSPPPLNHPALSRSNVLTRLKYNPRQNYHISTQESSSTSDEEHHDGAWVSSPGSMGRASASSLDGGSTTSDAAATNNLSQKEKREYMEKVLREDEEKYLEKVRRKKLGKYANVTTKSEFKALEEADLNELDLETQRSMELAKAQGVEVSTIAPREIDAASGDGRALSLPSISDKALQKARALGWDDVGIGFDIDLDDGELDYEPTVSDGKIVTPTSSKSGFQVNSAGGWSLEVFPGDFVVHRKYGIGRFDGITTKSKTLTDPDDVRRQAKRRKARLLRLKNKGATDEQLAALRNRFGTDDDADPISNPQISVLIVAYADAAVHVPVERAYRLSRYRAGDATVKPRLSRVKGDAWKKAKDKVMEGTAALAQDVLALYATRETLTRHPFDPALEDKMELFSESFHFTPTPDQERCFEAVENDMVWRKRPMDRLICGDVGFGKTEVAMRGLYRCAINGRQAALLAPTGVLASQHYKNVLARMEPFGIKCAMLRGGMGKNTKAGKELRAQLASGEVSLVVGTHALLSNGLEFKDLGLLVVDEEQRFGVKQKERLKLICNGVDVLTLSATPIPRTLQMSLSGIRDTSTLRSPPPMRKATMTVVEAYDDNVVYQAIKRELDRGGQCYYVVPRISMIEEAEKSISRLFDDIKIVVAHGRMPRHGAEESVSQFAEGSGHVLLATTVIENGVDIPTVNTIIIQNAHMFGMSTLYQLRGRVGRSDQQAYAYFLHKQDDLTEQSAARLKTMEDLQSLGSGFDVASRDLEIRGAGSLLGTEQSGMAARVGFDLYMKMLKRSVRRLRGLDLSGVLRTNVLLGDVIEDDMNDLSICIPENYIPNKQTRKQAETAARLAESTENLVLLTNDWKTNYGPLPNTIKNKLKTLHLHACTRQLGIDLVAIIDQTDVVLRAPGLRPRHIAFICASLPRQASPKNLNVVFPGRFVGGEDGKDDMIIEAGSKVDVQGLLNHSAEAQKGGIDEEEEWDALDREEVEAMKEISSAMTITSVENIDLESYPRFVIPGLIEFKNGKATTGGRKIVDKILQALLPAVKVVNKKQKEDKEQAVLAAELRQKRESMKKRRKQESLLEFRNRNQYNIDAN